MALPQCSVSLVLILALATMRPAHGFRNHHAHGSFRRHDQDGNFTQFKSFNSANLNIRVAKDHSDPDRSVGNRVMQKILKMQIKTCVHMKSLYETKFKAYEECLDILLKLCNPGKDMIMDGDPGETPTGQGFCRTYFGYEKIMRDEVREHVEECIALAEKQSRDSEDGGRLKACEPFMTELCAKNAGKLMDSKSKRQLTGQGYCQRYFKDKDGTPGNSHCCNRDCERECERWSTNCCNKCCKRKAAHLHGSGGDTAAVGASGSGGERESGEEGSAMRAEGSPEVGGTAGEKSSVGTDKIAGAAVLGLCLIGLCSLGFCMFFRKSASEEAPEQTPQN